jgi:hypothetical protein
LINVHHIVSFVFEKEQDNTILHHLHIRDIISINIENKDNFAIIKAIFCHQKDNLRFAFVVVDWFEKLNRTMLDCPMYRLQTIILIGEGFFLLA